VEQLEDEKASIRRRTYAHQYYNRLLITEVTIRRKANVQGAISYELQKPWPDVETSEDFNFEKPQNIGNYRMLRGATIDIEFEEFQSKPIGIVVYYTPVEATLTLADGQSELTKTYITSADINEWTAKDEFQIAYNMVNQNKGDELFQQHSTRFNNIWKYGGIEIDNAELKQVVHSSYYYLMSSIPSIEHYGKLNQFYGLSPGSLSRGANLTDYQGHSFWDTGESHFLSFNRLNLGATFLYMYLCNIVNFLYMYLSIPFAYRNMDVSVHSHVLP
jgi:protein-glucosylgalactosylhydroxylysine glucosidase